MPYGDPDHCRLVIRHGDGTVESRAWDLEEWPPVVGQLVQEPAGTYRIAAIRREGETTVAVALPVGRVVRKLD